MTHLSKRMVVLGACASCQWTGGPQYLKLHGSTNWLTPYSFIDLSTGERKTISGYAINKLFVFYKATEPYQTYETRYWGSYKPYNYCYYPPNLPCQRDVRNVVTCLRAVTHRQNGWFFISCGLLVDLICLFRVLLLMQQLRGWKFDEIQTKSSWTKKEIPIVLERDEKEKDNRNSCFGSIGFTLWWGNLSAESQSENHQKRYYS